MAAHYRTQLAPFVHNDANAVLGSLTKGTGNEGFTDHKHAQTKAWQEQIALLQTICGKMIHDFPECGDWEVLLEYPIPRRAKRIDAVILAHDVIIVLEFKIGKTTFDLADQRQVEDYCLDLQDFHTHSAGRLLVPVLVTPSASAPRPEHHNETSDCVQPVYLANRQTLADCIFLAYKRHHRHDAPPLDPHAWDKSPYRPTPTIIEAAQALYAGQNVREISRSHAGAENLTKTADAILRAVADAKDNHRKTICFVTGVPGSGKTLAGLNIVHNPILRNSDGELGVFLSGNGPLVKVLSEALARDHSFRMRKNIGESRRKVSTFIQNVHRFIGTYADSTGDSAPPDHVILFDEAQRAWTADQEYKKFKRNESEPHMMLRIMDRHPDWAVIVALIGGGQEIHNGEAGLPEWGHTLSHGFAHWRILISPELVQGGAASAGQPLFEKPPNHLDIITDPNLHLAVSVRAYRATSIAEWVNAVLDERQDRAKAILRDVHDYPVGITRSLPTAKHWLQSRTRGRRRSGLVASSGGRRLRAWGLDVATELDVAPWFLQPSDDVRSSSYLEVPATEFAIQGLELDWVGVCWDADLRRVDGHWSCHRFSGTTWQSVHHDLKRRYMLNKYRVLLTRGRQGMVIWVPEGSKSDPTRRPEWYDSMADYLRSCGVQDLG